MADAILNVVDDKVELVVEGSELLMPIVQMAQGYAQNAATSLETARQVVINGTAQVAVYAAQATAAVDVVFADGTGVFGGPGTSLALSDSALSRQVWLNPQPVPRSGVLRTINANVKQVGRVIFGFANRDGAVQLRVIITFTALGRQSVAVPAAIVRAGWLFGQISDGALDSGLIGYSNYGYALNGPAIAAGVATASLSVAPGVTIAAGFTLAADDEMASMADLTSARVTIASSKLQAQPDNWFANNAAWTFGPNGMTSPAAGQGWNTYIQTAIFTRLEQRLIRARLTGMTAATIVGLAALAPDQGAPLYEGNGRGPSMVTVDFASRTIAIKGQPNGAGDPGTVVSAPLAAGHRAINPHIVEWGWHVRAMTLTLIDAVSQARTTIIDDRNTQIDTGNPAGNMNDALAFLAIAGQFTVNHLKVMYDRPRAKAKVLYLADSIGQGDQQLAAMTVSRMLDAELGGAVAISAMGGGRARGAYMCAVNEIPALRPKWVIVAVGTNLSAPGDSSGGVIGTTLWKAYVENIIMLAKSYGAKVILTTLLNTAYGDSQGNYNAINTAALAFAAAYPDDVYIWQWNRALSIDGMGAAADPAKFHADLVHPIDAGHAALLAQLRLDVSQLFD
ncbi:SGNH/GDSL hydrolase family protein [Sphingomonas sp. PAMC26645]|uniref:SGNH/GDSL hydrolase family protein n=1 Tax=Sphingomonas sp. PAMC26645 TaxID=2565555 RepID=UPI00109DA7E1|nr:SGNH/GDSL hydrolase family protein [Sphingomonas sp. PAMC26645]QCB42241.1 SGNH/GDSL hydrolase family protein [Sphingomonas sp. PAMC26645]